MMRLRLLPVSMFLGVLALAIPQHQVLASTGSFVDDDNSRWEGFIERARQEGIVTGCNPPQNDRFCPHYLVTRGTMAIMLARALRAEPTEGDHFVDDDGHRAEGAIEALIGVGMTFGCDIDRFCPDRPITRGEMAVLISGALGLELTADTERYTDLGGSLFGEPLAELARRGAIEACDVPVNQRLCPDRTVRREEAVFSLVAALGLEPVELPTHSRDVTPIDFGDSFDELSLWDGRSPGYRNRVELTGQGFSTSALRVHIPEGSHYGADFRLDFSRTIEEEPEHLFFRYFLKLDSDWATTSSGKLPGFSGVYGTTGKGGFQSLPSEPGWSARLMFSPSGGADPRARLGFYVYHLGQSTRYGDSLGWNEAGKLVPGQWYCLEGEIEMNTLGLADGALRAWVDGTPAIDRTGLEFRRRTEPEIRIESFWFNVYYGGKAPAERDLGLTIDEVVVDTKRVGCQVGEGTGRRAEGDFNSDGYADRIWWATCPGGSCFKLETASESGSITTNAGNGAWFSLETHRFGLTAGDVDGDGVSELVYRGRCEGSMRCWRVHDVTDGRVGIGESWGVAAGFSRSAVSVALGDWNGDGTADLLYQGECGGGGHVCWKMHPSAGNRFEEPLDWGAAPRTSVSPLAADVNGDGLDDVLYPLVCDLGDCWVVQKSNGSGFEDLKVIGQARPSELTNREVIDFDDDGDDDLVTWISEEGSTTIDVRFATTEGLTGPNLLAVVDTPVSDVLLRRLGPGKPVQALLAVACEESGTCFDYLVAPSSERLADPDSFRKVVHSHHWSPPIL